MDGIKKAEDVEVDIESTSTAEDVVSLEERKLEYATLASGKLLRSQSSVSHPFPIFVFS